MEAGNSDLPLGKSGSGKIFGHTAAASGECRNVRATGFTIPLMEEAVGYGRCCTGTDRLKESKSAEIFDNCPKEA